MYINQIKELTLIYSRNFLSLINLLMKMVQDGGQYTVKMKLFNYKELCNIEMSKVNS